MSYYAQEPKNPSPARHRTKILRIEMKGPDQLPPAFYTQRAMFPRHQLSDACRGTLHGLSFFPEGQERHAKKRTISPESAKPNECYGWWHLSVPWFLQYLKTQNRVQYSIWMAWLNEKGISPTASHTILVHPDFCHR